MGKGWTLAENDAQGKWTLPDGRHRLEKRHFERPKRVEGRHFKRAEGAQRLKRVEKSPPAAARDSSTSLRFARNDEEGVDIG